MVSSASFVLDVHALWPFRAFQQSDGKEALCDWFPPTSSWVEWCSEYVLVGFLWLSAFGCNSICKSCCKKLLNKFYSPSHTVPQLPGWGLLLCQSSLVTGLQDQELQVQKNLPKKASVGSFFVWIPCRCGSSRLGMIRPSNSGAKKHSRLFSRKRKPQSASL